MACTRPTDTNTCQSDLTHLNPSDIEIWSSLVEKLFDQLPGTWMLDRHLQSTNTAEPAGKCTGTATFTSREPSVFIDRDGKLELASAEMVYHEQGYFDMQQSPSAANNVRFPFSRKYVWRMQQTDSGLAPVLSIWFTKPGTDKVDYLFHKINVTHHAVDNDVNVSKLALEGEGCHLCEDDLYSSAYTFTFITDEIAQKTVAESFYLQNWTMLHEVRGPQKDQVIETRFDKG